MRSSFIALLALFLSVSAHAEVNVQSPVCVSNFAQPICGDFSVMPAIIIKTEFSKEKLQELLGRKVQQIAFLGQVGLYLLSSERPLEEAAELASRAGIIYAQPDIVQTRFPSGQQVPATVVEQEMPLIAEFWRQNNRGKGVNVAVIDDGFNFRHPDLEGVEVVFNYDADNKSLDASPKMAVDTHGTMVAGVIFAQHNGIGVDGIAPDASLIAIRQPSSRTSDTVLSFTVAALSHADVINCSWNSQYLMRPVYDVINYVAENGRKGKGTAIVVAAGNDGVEVQSLEREAGIDSVITVAALSPGGELARYSNFGDLVDVAVVGSVKTTKHVGYHVFNGTSASAAIVSGVAALVLAEHPEFNVKQLLSMIRSSRVPRISVD